MIEELAFTSLRWLSTKPRLEPLLDRMMRPINLFSVAASADPYPAYAAVRDLDPVHFHRGTQTWLVTGYRECRQLLGGPVSSQRGDFLENISPYKQMSPDSLHTIFSSLIMQDPPVHTRLRRAVEEPFTERSVASLDGLVAEVVDEVVDEVDRRLATDPASTVDLHGTFTSQVPHRVMARVLGIPAADTPLFVRHTATVATVVEPFVGFDPAAMDASIAELRQLLRSLMGSEESTGLIRALWPPGTSSNGGEDRIGGAEEEVLQTLLLLVIGGFQTTESFLGNALVALSDRPDVYRELATAGTSEALLEELLRFDCPVQLTDRIMLQDLELGGHTLRAGDAVLAVLGAANRDPSVFDAPDELRLDRHGPPSIAFGHGPHHCLGWALAKLTTRTSLTAFATRFHELAVDRCSVRWSNSLTFRGPTALPARLGR